MQKSTTAHSAAVRDGAFLLVHRDDRCRRCRVMLPPCEAVDDGGTVALRSGRCKVLFGFYRCVVLGFRWILIFMRFFCVFEASQGE
jgi:hypothetical protein